MSRQRRAWFADEARGPRPIDVRPVNAEDRVETVGESLRGGPRFGPAVSGARELTAVTDFADTSVVRPIVWVSTRPFSARHGDLPTSRRLRHACSPGELADGQWFNDVAEHDGEYPHLCGGPEQREETRGSIHIVDNIIDNVDR